MSGSPSSIGSGLTEENDKSSARPRRKSRFSFGNSGRSFLRSSSGTSQGARSLLQESFSSRRSDGSPKPSDSGEFGGKNFSEVSSGSSASQIRTMSRVLAKQFDKMAVSTRSVLLDRSSSSPKGSSDTTPDRLDIKSRNLEIILDATVDIAGKLQIFFNKHKEAIAGDKRAVNLEEQNARIRSLGHQIFTTVAFYGDNGAGKSSLINALLDRECITPTSNSDSCTAMPIEFRARDRGQNMRSGYTVIADIMTDEEWLPVVKKLLEDLKEDPADPKSIAARDALGVLSGLTEEELVEEGGSIGLEKVDKIPSACRGLAKRFNSQSHLQLQEHIKVLNTCYWPVLKKTTIYMDSPVLNTGVILVDLPGLGKMNPMKAEIVNSYLKSCESIFVVSDVSRAGMDDLLLDPMFEPIARRAQLEASSKFAFIFTQTDNVVNIGGTPGWNKKQAILERIETTRGLIKRSPQSRLSSAEVFYVSSLEYQWNHNRLVNLRTTPNLSVEDSGVPSVRRFIQEKGLQLREAVVKSLVQGNMMSFMNSVQIWCNDNTMPPEAPEPVPLELQASRFEELKKSAHNAITGVSETLSVAVKLFKEEISQDFIEDAAKKARESIIDGEDAWVTVCYHYTQIMKACRNRGVFQDKKTKKHYNWNKQLVDPLVSGIIEPWNSAFNPPDAEIQAIFNKVSEDIFKIISESINHGARHYNDLHPINKRTEDIVDAQRKRWEKGLGKVNYMFTNDENVIREKLGSTYEELSVIVRGSKPQKREIVRRKLSGFILDHYKELCTDVFNELDKLTSELDKDLAAGLDTILNDIESSYFHQPERIPQVVDLTNVKAELLDLCKVMKELEHLASRPRTTEVGL